MIDGNRILVIVPARGGSKGIKLKNLRKVGGKSLVELVANIVSELSFVDRSIISTDHEKIASVAKSNGLDAPFLRPAIFSGDLVSDTTVLTHALLELENLEHQQYDIIIMLQPTSPFRTAAQVEETVRKLIHGKFDSVMTVSRTDSKAHPLKQLTLQGDRLGYFDDRGKRIIARQQLEPLYHRNGIAYALTRNCLIEQKTTIGQNASAVVINKPCPNIDTVTDLEWSSWLIKTSSARGDTNNS
jgi:CMP-N-acetylneuraminic acid synthetase